MLLKFSDTLTEPPRRIVSLVPSQTELLFALGLEDRVVGVTKFCVHPPHWRKTKAIVGGTKNVHLDRVHALQPDLIIANKEENVREQVFELAADYPVWVTEVTNLPTALGMIQEIGQLTHTHSQAQQLAEEIEQAFAEMTNHDTLSPSVAYLIWRDPYLSVGGDTFIAAMLEQAGFVNVFAEQQRYPEVTPTVLAARNPDFIFLSSEPYPFKEKHRAELSAICPTAKILLVDGEAFSWYGSRLLPAARYFRNLRNKTREL